MGLKIFYNLESAVRFLREYEESNMNYQEMFKDAGVSKVEVTLRMERPEKASFHISREVKPNVSNIVF